MIVKWKTFQHVGRDSFKEIFEVLAEQLFLQRHLLADVTKVNFPVALRMACIKELLVFAQPNFSHSLVVAGISIEFDLKFKA